MQFLSQIGWQRVSCRFLWRLRIMTIDELVSFRDSNKESDPSLKIAVD